MNKEQQQQIDEVFADESRDMEIVDGVMNPERAREAGYVVKDHVIMAMGVSLIPVPMVDLAALVGIQLKMLHSLSERYNVPFSDQLGKSLIASLVGGMLPSTLLVAGSSLLKFIPGVGTIGGMAGMSLLGGALTYAVGQVFIRHFESGGTLLDFDPERVRDSFREEVQKGREIVEKLRMRAKENKALQDRIEKSKALASQFARKAREAGKSSMAVGMEKGRGFAGRAKEAGSASLKAGLERSRAMAGRIREKSRELIESEEVRQEFQRGREKACGWLNQAKEKVQEVKGRASASFHKDDDNKD